MQGNLRYSILALIVLQIITITPFLLDNNSSLVKSGRSYAIALYPLNFSFTDVLNAVIASDGSLIKTGAWHGISFSSSTTDDFKHSLYENGAWLVLSPAIITLCYQKKGR
ncbi:MAG: hypothetical protein CL561_04150 [Alphaproteobacteria bacterium]|nr:hypothetical protein [Alphaproteobacteria bacterium]|tara:strand:+ start:1147 stop:1476 length:330 start_codon:yes stop_codon:yes gene_type:complete